MDLSRRITRAHCTGTGTVHVISDAHSRIQICHRDPGVSKVGVWDVGRIESSAITPHREKTLSMCILSFSIII
jgi:hypothetical protein